jgi:hypothetical protein
VTGLGEAAELLDVDVKRPSDERGDQPRPPAAVLAQLADAVVLLVAEQRRAVMRRSTNVMLMDAVPEDFRASVLR